ncbi:MAG: FAD-binding protein [Xenophilus sp.]
MTIRLETDVLVLGGGPAGTWAALSAAQAGARVILADKAYCGTSGAAAASNNTIWYVPDERDHARHYRERGLLGGGLNEPGWVSAVLGMAVTQLHRLAQLGYPFPRSQDGSVNYASLRGPDYLRCMRHLIGRAGVSIMDHSPAASLMQDGDGAVTGAIGTTRQGAHWRVSAGATVIATGGCAFLSGALGTNVCTGDGHLAAAEAGATFSGMEFSCQYGIAPAFSSVTKGLPFHWASYYRADGREVDTGDEEPFIAVARVLEQEAVYACFDRADANIERWLRSGQANAFLPYDRLGIDPFRERFAVALLHEGTVRGTGGILLRDRTCATTVPGLYAAGDAASREPIVGGRSGGGSPNAAWAVTTGSWAGASAAQWALERHGASPGDMPVPPAALADPAHARCVIHSEVWPTQKSLFRESSTMGASLQALDEAWHRPSPADVAVAQGRSARAMLLVARMANRSAQARRESRALHRRLDYPDTLRHPRHVLVRGSSDLEVWHSPPLHAEAP